MSRRERNRKPKSPNNESRIGANDEIIINNTQVLNRPNLPDISMVQRSPRNRHRKPELKSPLPPFSPQLGNVSIQSPNPNRANARDTSLERYGKRDKLFRQGLLVARANVGLDEDFINNNDDEPIVTETIKTDSNRPKPTLCGPKPQVFQINETYQQYKNNACGNQNWIPPENINVATTDARNNNRPDYNGVPPSTMPPYWRGCGYMGGIGQITVVNNNDGTYSVIDVNGNEIWRGPVVHDPNTGFYVTTLNNGQIIHINPTTGEVIIPNRPPTIQPYPQPYTQNYNQNYQNQNYQNQNHNRNNRGGEYNVQFRTGNTGNGAGNGVYGANLNMGGYNTGGGNSVVRNALNARATAAVNGGTVGPGRRNRIADLPKTYNDLNTEYPPNAYNAPNYDPNYGAFNYGVYKGTQGGVYNPQTNLYMATGKNRAMEASDEEDDTLDDGKNVQKSDPTKAGGCKNKNVKDDECKVKVNVELEEAQSSSSAGSSVGSEIESEGDVSVWGGSISESSSDCEEEKCCPNLCVDVPEFCILPVIYTENASCVIIASSSNGQPPPMLGSSIYPYENSTSIDGSGNVTWIGYNLQISSQNGWSLTQCTEIYASGQYIWGHGPNNFNYYIGNGYKQGTDASGNPIDSSPINYINYVFGDDPSPTDIAAVDQISFTYLTPRGYLVSDFIGSGDQIYNFLFRLALVRVWDTTSSSFPWRYYVEFQRLDNPGIPTYPATFPQIMTFNTLPEVGSDVDVSEAPIESFGYTPGQTFRVALWGQQGPQPYSRRSHSDYVYATPTELNIVVADEAAQKAAQAAVTADPTNPDYQADLVAANAKLAADTAVLQSNYSRIRVWPSTNGPISLNAWIGMPCQQTLDVYYICKFMVSAQYPGVNSSLVVSSRSKTKPLGAPTSYYHYTKHVELDQFAGLPGKSQIVPGAKIYNPWAVEGWRGHKGTVGYLRFIPIVSNSTYDNCGNITGRKNPLVPFGDTGFLMAVSPERVRGMNIRDMRPNEWNHEIFWTRPFPWPAGVQPAIFGTGVYQIEPSLLHRSSYKLLKKIDYDGIGTTDGANWNFQTTTNYGNGPVPTQGFETDGTILTPAHAATGQFVYSTTTRKKNDVDDNTLIIKLTIPIYS